jgi:nitrate/nitrite transporter NarK
VGSWIFLFSDRGGLLDHLSLCDVDHWPYFSKGQSAAIGLVSTSGGVGVCLFPFVMSAVSERSGLVTGFLFYLVLTGLMCGCAWLAMVLLNRRA